MNRITEQTAIYTGGGIYFYYGKAFDAINEAEVYFMGTDDGIEFVNCAVNPDNEDIYYNDWLNEHWIRSLEEIEVRDFLIQLYKRIVTYGCSEPWHENYQKHDFESKLRNLMKGGSI